MNHLTPDEVDALVMRGDPLADAPRQHLAICHACATWIEREARLELAIYEAAAVLEDRRAGMGRDEGPSSQSAGRQSAAAAATVAAPVWRYALSAAAVLMLGAAGWLIVRRERPDTPQVTVASLHPRAAAASGPPALNTLLLPDTPCLRDPRAYMPGFDVVPPDPPGSRIAAPDFRP